MAVKFHEHRSRIETDRGGGNFTRLSSGSDKGFVVTVHGILKAHMSHKFTCLILVRRGIEIRRFWDHRYSRQYVVTLAKRMAHELVAKEPPYADA